MKSPGDVLTLNMLQLNILKLSLHIKHPKNLSHWISVCHYLLTSILRGKYLQFDQSKTFYIFITKEANVHQSIAMKTSKIYPSLKSFPTLSKSTNAHFLVKKTPQSSQVTSFYCFVQVISTRSTQLLSQVMQKSNPSHFILLFCSVNPFVESSHAFKSNPGQVFVLVTPVTSCQLWSKLQSQVTGKYTTRWL